MEPIYHPQTQRLIEKLSGNLPHALIVDGPVGVGVLTAAKQLAKSMDALTVVIRPKKSINGQMVVDETQGNIIIEDIRDLYEYSRTARPQTDVIILDTGERSMTTAAQNAFLKLLEEPRPNLHFIIATHTFSQLLPTIVSRSQRLSMLPVTIEQTAQFIQSLGITDATKAARLAFVGRGLPALIARLANDQKLYESRVEIMSDAKTVIAGTAYDKIAVIQKYKDDRGKALTLIDDMNFQLKTITVSRHDASLVEKIARQLDVRQAIQSGGNIRLQLLSAVL